MNSLKKLFSHHSQLEVIGQAKDILPILIRVNQKYSKDETVFFNAAYGHRLQKRIADDLACIFVLPAAEGPVVVDQKFLADQQLDAATVIGYAEQNLIHLFNSQAQTFQKKADHSSTLYTLVLNRRNEASTLLSATIWQQISHQLNDHLFVTVPSNHEIHYSAVKSGNGLLHLMNQARQAYNAAGAQKLSPSVYLFYNSRWQVFEKGIEEIFEFCMEHKLITGFL